MTTDRPQIPLYRAIARTLAWDPPADSRFRAIRAERLKAFEDMLPSGSGWDNGTTLDYKSTPDKIVLYGSFHHMDENGYYVGWTDHVITIRPSLAWGYTLTVSGRNRNDVKDYLHEMFDRAISEMVDEYPELPVAESA